jgi:hypothetical protein
MKIRFSWFLLSSILIPTLLLAGCGRALTQVNASPVFTTKDITTNVPPEMRGTGVRRVRAVEINLNVFNGSAPKTTQMNFFPNVSLDVEWTSTQEVQRPDGIVWNGKVVGSPLSQATLVVSGRNVTGNISRGDGWMYQIRTTADGRWWVREIDQKEFPRDIAPVVPEPK